MALLRNFFQRVTGRASAEPSPAPAPTESPSATPHHATATVGDRPKGDGTAAMVDELIQQDRYALLLRPKIAATLSMDYLEQAHVVLADTMALVPDGEVLLQCDETVDTCGAQAPDPRALPEEEVIVQIEPLLLDRFAVTNRQFQKFVDAGGYALMDLWDPDVWSALLQFVDSTNLPGPRSWRDGRYSVGHDAHPVVGICWYEAAAYARWVGKRLPSDAEWVKAAAWPVRIADGNIQHRRFPWGNSMENSRANLWQARLGETCDVAAFEEGVSVGGVYGMVGNVWEWTSTPFGSVGGRRTGETIGDFAPESPLKSIRGGAFDTYFETHASAHFQSADDPLARKHNIGFRCALSLCDVATEAAPEPPEEVSETPASAPLTASVDPESLTANPTVTAS